MLESLHTKASVHTNGRHNDSTAKQHIQISQQNEQITGARIYQCVEATSPNPPALDSGSAANGPEGPSHEEPAAEAQQAQQAQQEQPGPAQDVAAFGRLAVQLYRGRMMYHSPSDHRFWAKEVSRLPCPCQALARACLQPTASHRPTAAALLDCNFFPQPIRTAAFFLAALHPASPPAGCNWQMPLSDHITAQDGVSLMDTAPWLIGKAQFCHGKSCSAVG